MHMVNMYKGVWSGEWMVDKIAVSKWVGRMDR